MRRLETMPCVSISQPSGPKRTVRLSHLPSPSVSSSRQTFGMLHAMQPFLYGSTPVGMLRLSAKIVGLSTTPSPSLSEKTTILSLLLSSAPSGDFHNSFFTAHGYSADDVH